MVDYENEWQGDVDNLSAFRGCLVAFLVMIPVWIAALVLLFTVIL
jgi:hypothetical protein